MLTPFGYYKIRLIDAVRKRRSTLIFFVFCMFFAGIIFFIPPSQYGEAAGGVSHLSIGNVSPQDPLLAVEVVERKQSPTPTFPLRLTPTLLPVSNTGVIWSSQGDGAYLWDSPDGSILTMLPNGRVVKFLGERQVYGNVHWVKIQNASGEGWLSWSHIHRVSDLPVAYVADEKWTYLRDRPRGKVLTVLTVGTPIMRIFASQKVEGQSWVQVELLNGAVGWAIEELLVNEQSFGELY